MAASSRSLGELYREEFSDYSFPSFRRDLFAGLTVAAVALPLALAFGVASGATAAAGLVTAILAGLIIGLLSGAPYQISGPTGAMSAVLIVLAQRYGLEAVWISGVLSGVLLLVLGLLRLGRFISFIPAPVVTGFTSGIAVIIAVGQLEAALGISPLGAHTPLEKLELLWSHSVVINPAALVMAMSVVALILSWPAEWTRYFPASLLAIVLATLSALGLGLSLETISAIPQSIILTDRLTLSAFSTASLDYILVPTISITVLGAVESLLCGAVAGNMTGKRLQANQELIAQGAGNIVIPFFGGVPATAAIARTSVGIRSGGLTRMVSVVQALALLLSLWLLAPVISQIPLAALAGVLIATAWRMNEWEAIRFYFSHRLSGAMLKFTITLLATITLDLSWAIAIGCGIAAVMFLNQASQISITVTPIDPLRLPAGVSLDPTRAAETRVAYITGPLFFAATGHLAEAFNDLTGVRTLILSMRGVPLLDSSGLKAISDLQERIHSTGGQLWFAGLNPPVEQVLRKGKVLSGVQESFWSSGEAIAAAAGA